MLESHHGAFTLRRRFSATTGDWAVLAGVVWMRGAKTQAQELAIPSGDGIAARWMVTNAERQAALESYTSERTYRVEYQGTGGVHPGEIVVRAEYLRTGQKRLTVVGEICESVLPMMVESEQEASEKANRMQMMLSPASYNLRGGSAGRASTGDISGRASSGCRRVGLHRAR